MSYLPALATSVYPSRDEYRGAWDWWLDASPGDRLAFEFRRLDLASDLCRHVGGTVCHSSGSTGAVKTYQWGPNFNEMYSFILHDLVRKGTRCKKVAAIHLGGAHLDSRTTFGITESPSNPIVQTWITINQGAEDLYELSGVLADHDVIVCPSHFEIMHQYGNLGDFLDRDSLILSTGEPLDEFCYLGFRGEVRDWMRCWDGGATFYTCQYGFRHRVDMLANMRIEGCKDLGNLISTDYFNLTQTFHNYKNGDVVFMKVDSEIGHECKCGRPVLYIYFENRSDAISIKTPSGHTFGYTTLRNIVMNNLSVCPTHVTFGISRDQTRLQVDVLGTPIDKIQPFIKNAMSTFGFKEVNVSDKMHGNERKQIKIYFLD